MGRAFVTIFLILIDFLAVKALLLTAKHIPIHRAKNSRRASNVIDIEERKDPEVLKKQLLKISALTNRGEFATQLDKDMALKLAEDLESINTTEEPCRSISGEWDLILSTTYLFRSSPFFMAARAVCKDGDEANRFAWFCQQRK